MKLHQDFYPQVPFIMQLWQQRKLKSQDAISELMLSRGNGSQRAVEHIRFHEQNEVMLFLKEMRKRQASRIEQGMATFREHASIDRWLEQFRLEEGTAKVASRFKALLLRGRSRSGKSQKSCSLFGAENTLVVNCQGMSPALPSIQQFDRCQHAAILWDEIDEQQVLHNKICFQSGNELVSLQQSACNAHTYQKYLYSVPMMMCSNTFSFTTSSGKGLPPHDVDWLQENIIEASIPPEDNWFIAG